MVNPLLSSYSIDVKELIEDLAYQWKEQEDSKYNLYAFSKAKPTGENIMFCCPKHAETNPSCGIISEYPYGWNCFGCGASGNIASLVGIALGLKGELQGEQYILKHYLITSASERKPIDMNLLLDGNDLDRKRSLFEEDIQKFSTKRHSYIERRGFSNHTLIKYEIGYDEKQKAITFPVRTSKGLIRFIKKRFVERKGFLNESGIDKKDVLYGLYYILQSPNEITEIFLNESETDTMSCYESKMAACAILGRILFKQQVLELARSNIKTVNLFFDNDIHGVKATIKAYQLISNLTAIRVNVVIYPGGHWGIDGINEMLYKDANALLLSNQMKNLNIVSFDKFISLLNYKNELEFDEMDLVII